MNGNPDAAAIRAVIDDAIDACPHEGGRALNGLTRVQEVFGFVPDDAISLLAERLEVEREQLEGLCDFFDEVKRTPEGDYVIEVCDGTACHTRGAVDIAQALEAATNLQVGQTAADGRYTLRTVHCVGACNLAPVVVVNGETFGRVRLKNIPSLVRQVTDRER